MHSLMNQFRFLRVGRHDDVLVLVSILYSLLLCVNHSVQVIACPRRSAIVFGSSEKCFVCAAKLFAQQSIISYAR